MSKKSKYASQQKVDYFGDWEKNNLKPKLKFLEEITLETAPIKKAVKNISLSRTIRARIAEIKASKEAISFAMNPKKLETIPFEESVVQKRRFELINIKKIITSLYLS